MQRMKVVASATEGRTSVAEAAELLGLSERQVKRLKRKYRPTEGEWVHHGNRGRRPANAIAAETRQRVIEWAKGKYAGFNDSHLQEKLSGVEGVAVSRASVRRILREAGLRSPQKRRAPKYRARRERRAQEGMLVQVDGSRHDWLEGRGPYLTLMGAVDDATNEVSAAHFQREHEDSAGYLRLFRQQVEGRGIPWAIYRDQHSTLQRNDEHWSLEEQLAGKQLPTQVGRALEELGIEVIVARSPQAKGRIERTWRTFQDRLTSELRLAQATNVEEASVVLTRFLPEYRQRFGKTATRPTPVWRKLDSRLDLDYIFSLRYERVVGKDHVITAIPGVTIQLPPLASGRGYAGRKVEVCHQPNGDFQIYLDRRLLHSQPAAADAGPVRAQPFRRTKAPHKKKPVRIYQFAGRPANRLS